jgi:catalase
VRFSTVIHGGHSPETLRDPRGFAVKFYTEDGNWDLVGNNLQGLLHPRRDQVPRRGPRLQAGPGDQPAGPAGIFDFISQTPEAMHMVTWLFSPWGIPANYREMQGSGVQHLQVGERRGRGVLVKYHWIPKQGVAT